MKKALLHVAAFLLNAYSFVFPGVNPIKLPRPKGLEFNFGLENDGSDGCFTLKKDCLPTQTHEYVEMAPDKYECAHCGIER